MSDCTGPRPHAFAAGRQLDVDAPFRAAADAGAAAGILAAAFPDQRVGAGEEIRMILDELAQAMSMRSSSPSAMKIRLTASCR